MYLPKNKSFHLAVSLALVLALGLGGCQKGDLLSNPNAASESTSIPVSLLLNHITWSVYRGGGVVDANMAASANDIDGATGAVIESPWNAAMKLNQFYLSNNQYYQGLNAYNWSNTATAYDILKYVVLMETQAAKQYPSAPTTNVYAALGKFFRAYQFIWLTQRVGDIPMTQAGNPTNLTPSYNSQHDVYKNSLALLDTANTYLGNLVTATNQNTAVDAGDIFGLTYLQWQKVVNTYKLRILISLSKRATDNADLNIPQQFAAIIANATKYPIMTGNADNIVFKYNSVNTYPTANTNYNNLANIGQVYLNITTANQDPRTFAVATPAPAQLTAGKAYSDFTAYVGGDPSLSLTVLTSNNSAGMYSNPNYNRYCTSTTGANAELPIIIGYPELCFNIAEAINRQWITSAGGSNSEAWYLNGINASLSTYGITDGKVMTVGDATGKAYGTVTVNLSDFLTNVNVKYKGDNSDGLAQILTQKYVAFFQNSGWEAFYNYRRTGIPAFAQGAGTGTANNLIPRRWEYPLGELNYNATNCKAAISSQFGGTDDVSKDMWLTK